MISQTHDTRTPREWLLLKSETRVASLILEAIDLFPSARDQADAIWSAYRDYWQSEAAQAHEYRADKIDRAVLLEEAVASALLNLATLGHVGASLSTFQRLSRERVTR